MFIYIVCRLKDSSVNFTRRFLAVNDRCQEKNRANMIGAEKTGTNRTGLTYFTRDYTVKVATERAHLRVFTGWLVHTPS